MGCSHAQFDSSCSSCLLQYDQAESARWAAEEAHLQRLNAEDHQRRMEQEAARRSRPQATPQPNGGFPRAPIPSSFSNRTMLWIFALGAVVVVGSSVLAFVASLAALIVQLVKLVLVFAIVAAVALYVLKKRKVSGD